MMTLSLPIVASLALLVSASAHAQGPVSYRHVALPFDISLQVPQDWWVLDDGDNAYIRARRDSALSRAGLPLPDAVDSVLFAANSLPRTTYAGVRVTYTKPRIAAPKQVVMLSQRDLEDVSMGIRESLKLSLASQGLTLLEWAGTTRETVATHVALHSQYRRSGPAGPVHVHLYQLYLEEASLKVNMSYRESEAQIWRPVIAHMLSSMIVGRKASR